MDEKLKLADTELQLAAENLASVALVAEHGLFRNAVTDLYHAGLTADYKGYVDVDRSDYAEAARQARVVVQAVILQIRLHRPQLDPARLETLLAKL